MDASVTLAWFLDKPVPSYANRVKDSLLLDAQAIVPALWHLEVANGFVVAERRRIFSPDDSQTGLSVLEKLIHKVVQTRTDLVPARQALNVARTWGLSAYDAIYLDLARQLHLPIATMDNALVVAAKRAGVAMF